MESLKSEIEHHHNQIENPLLTDCYQIMMIYCHWKNNRHESQTVYDLYFRKSPFNLPFSIVGGVDECLDFVTSFKFTEENLAYLKSQFPHFEDSFIEYLRRMNFDDVKIIGLENGSIILPNTPLLSLKGPINKVQLIETNLLNLTNYSTLIASLAIKIRLMYPDKILIESGSEYGQSPDGSLSGSKYSYIGTIDKTTNLLAVQTFGLDLHSVADDNQEFFKDVSKIPKEMYDYNQNVNLIDLTDSIIKELGFNNNLRSIDFKRRLLQAHIFPNNFEIKIKETFDLKQIKNHPDIVDYIIISKAMQSLNQFNQILFFDFQVDSSFVKELKSTIKSEFKGIDDLKILIAIKYYSKMIINKVEGDFDIIYLGPEFITSETTTALGMVYKLMDFEGKPCIKFSEEKSKRTIPGFKNITRLFNEKDEILCDYLSLDNEAEIKETDYSLVGYYPYDEEKFETLNFTRKEKISKILFENGKLINIKNTSQQNRKKVLDSLEIARSSNPKVLVSKKIIDNITGK